MTLLFFVAAVAVAAVLRWQEKRQRLEADALRERMGLGPAPAPPAGMTEALLTAYLGVVALLFGGLSAWASLEGADVLAGEGALQDGTYELMVVLAGGGAALLVLGIRAMRRTIGRASA